MRDPAGPDCGLDTAGRRSGFACASPCPGKEHGDATGSETSSVTDAVDPNFVLESLPVRGLFWGSASPVPCCELGDLSFSDLSGPGSGLGDLPVSELGCVLAGSGNGGEDRTGFGDGQVSVCIGSGTGLASFSCPGCCVSTSPSSGSGCAGATTQIPGLVGLPDLDFEL